MGEGDGGAMKKIQHKQVLKQPTIIRHGHKGPNHVPTHPNHYQVYVKKKSFLHHIGKEIFLEKCNSKHKMPVVNIGKIGITTQTWF